MSNGDYIYSTLHNRLVPTPSTEVGVSGQLKSHWDGKESVLDELKRQGDEELTDLLSFEKTRTNKYTAFAGGEGERIRGGKSPMSKTFGTVASGGRSQGYRDAIVDYLQEKKGARDLNVQNVEREFRKKLDQIRVRSGIAARHKKGGRLKKVSEGLPCEAE